MHMNDPRAACPYGRVVSPSLRGGVNDATPTVIGSAHGVTLTRPTGGKRRLRAQSPLREAPTSGTRGFTLVEVLTVVAIMGILIALVGGGLQLAMRRAKYVKVAKAVDELRAAWLEYRNDRGRFPAVALSEMDAAAVAILRGDESPENPASTPFLDFRPGATEYVDIWGSPYRFALDTDYNNQVAIPGGTIRDTVAVWSIGKDKQNGTPDDIGTWME